MLDWIEQHQAALSIFISLGTLLVWLVYAQLLFFSFRRQRSPRIIINRGKRKNMDALCIISNMSKEAVYVEYIMAILHTSKGTITMDVTDFEQSYKEGTESDDKAQYYSIGSIQDNTRQGPLGSEDFMHIGRFSDIVKRLAHYQGIPMRGCVPDADIDFECLTIQVIALYGPDYRPISAKRSFTLNNDKNTGDLMPASLGTQQGSSFLHRRRLCKMVNAMNESNFSASSTIPRDNQ
ncbi:MAG TPA: hypothetical protein VIC08_07200 [Cellvibrionaceae bacterium]